MHKSLVFVVIPSWNGKDELKNAIPSLLVQSHPCQVVVVDNGSTDGTMEWLAKEYPSVQTVSLAKNFGFTAVNRGIELAIKQGAEFVALFNNDAVADTSWLKQLLKRMQQSPETGVVTGKLLRTNGTIDSVGEAYSIWGQAFPVGRNQRDRGQYNQPARVWGATGGASLYRVKMLQAIGLLDESYFAYYEDGDLSFRANLVGWQVWYEPKAVARHKVGATSSRLGGFRTYHRLKNTPLLYDKNMPARLFWKFLPRKLVGLTAMNLQALSKGQLIAVLKANFWLLLHMPAVLIKRFKIQRSRRLSTVEIEALLHHAAPMPSLFLSTLSRWWDRKYASEQT